MGWVGKYVLVYLDRVGMGMCENRVGELRNCTGMVGEAEANIG
jgi:hypothetical protein